MLINGRCIVSSQFTLVLISGPQVTFVQVCLRIPQNRSEMLSPLISKENPMTCRLFLTSASFPFDFNFKVTSPKSSTVVLGLLPSSLHLKEQ